MFGYLIDNYVYICFGMGFATIVLTITNLTVVTMHHNKDAQKEIIVIEAKENISKYLL